MKSFEFKLSSSIIYTIINNNHKTITQNITSCNSYIHFNSLVCHILTVH